MEKYIIILVILATIYFIKNNLKLTEGFQTTISQSVFGVDDLNAVNTLAQISRQLMSGGVNVPGNMTVSGAMTVNGEIRGAAANDQENGFKLPYHTWMKCNNTTGNGQDPYKILFENTGATAFRSPNGFQFRRPDEHRLFEVNNNGSTTSNVNVWHMSNDGKRRMYYANNGRSFFGSENGYVWRRSDDAVDMMTLENNSNLSVVNEIRANNGNARLGNVWTNPGIYSENGRHLEIGAGSNEIFTGRADWGVPNNFNVTGSLKVRNGVWHTSQDSINRTYYDNNGISYFGSGNGEFRFRTGANGGGADGVIINSGGLNVNSLNVNGVNILNEINWIKANMVKYRDKVRHVRTDGRWVRGDNTSDWDRSYSDWFILREPEQKNVVGL